jgi:hypothetical protein
VMENNVKNFLKIMKMFEAEMIKKQQFGRK